MSEFFLALIPLIQQYRAMSGAYHHWPCRLKPDKAFYRLRIVIVFLLLLFCSFAKIRWLSRSYTEQSLGKHKNGGVKSKYMLGTREAKFPLGKGK